MLIDYIHAALAKARYEKIDDPKANYYGEVPGLKGVWASGKTLEECRKTLAEVIQGWILIRVKKGLPIPAINKHRIEIPKELKVA